MGSKRYSFDTSLINKIDMQLLYIANSSFSSDWHSILHTHNNLELFYILSGTGSFRIESESFPIKKNDLIVINPKVLHTEESSDGEPIEYVVLGIDGLVFHLENNTGHECSKNYTILNLSKHAKSMEMYINLLLNETKTEHQSYTSICHNIAEIIINLINRYSKNDFEFETLESNTVSKECQSIYNYINLNYKETITLDMLADIVHMNKFYIAHTFKKSFGISPVNYVTKKRVDESKHLLAQADYSLSRIAEIVGFSSLSYFSQAFKKSVGMSPREYKNHINEISKNSTPNY